MIPNEFFYQLSVFSNRLLNTLGLSYAETAHTRAKFTKPVEGVVVHYTSGSDPIKTVRWFLEPKWLSGVSAHFVIAKNWPIKFKYLTEDLHLISDLPSMVVQCVPLDTRANHVRRMNSFMYGIELVNRGKMTKKLVRDFDPTETDGVYPARGAYWEGYSSLQLQSLVSVLRNLRTTFGIPYTRVLGHEHTQKNKFDPGPMLPLPLVRGEMSRDVSSGILDHVLLQRYVTTYAEHVWREWSGKWGTTDISLLMPEINLAFLNQDESVAKAGLKALGYDVTDLPFSIRMFQTMMGLKRDSVLGPKTIKAVYKRLKSRNFITK